MTLTVEDNIKNTCKEQGYDGLFNRYLNCSCLVDDLAPCDNIESYCEFGVKSKHSKDSNFYIIDDKDMDYTDQEIEEIGNEYSR